MGTTEVALAAYRPRAGKEEEELRRLLADVPPRELAGADVPFARWTLVVDL